MSNPPEDKPFLTDDGELAESRQVEKSLLSYVSGVISFTLPVLVLAILLVVFGLCPLPIALAGYLLSIGIASLLNKPGSDYERPAMPEVIRRFYHRPKGS